MVKEIPIYNMIFTSFYLVHQARESDKGRNKRDREIGMQEVLSRPLVKDMPDTVGVRMGNNKVEVEVQGLYPRQMKEGDRNKPNITARSHMWF